MTEKDSNFVRKHYRHNFVMNVMDGAFFGFALGFASFSTVIPLFVSKLNKSAILLGLIPAIHSVGWQLPQLLTARKVSAMPVVKPYVMMMTIHERLPFLGLAIIALFVNKLNPTISLLIIFALLIWAGLGAGVTANAWQIMIGKIIPSLNRGTFFGFQSAAANLLSSVGAIASGYLLEKNPYGIGYSICFFITSFLMLISWFFLNETKESNFQHAPITNPQGSLWQDVKTILKKDKPFLGYLISRSLFQVGTMAFSFYIIYAVRMLNLSESSAGIMTAVLMITMVLANPLLGWLADHWNHRSVLVMGAFFSAISSLLMVFIRQQGWFFLVMVLCGIASTAMWTIGITFTLEFGNDKNRPTYVGIIGTFSAPVAIIAPVFGGWLADYAGFSATFITSFVFSIITAFVLHYFVRVNKKTED